MNENAWGWVVGLVVVVLAGAGLYFAVASHRNRDNADRWRDRAETLQRTLTARSRQLDTRTTALNKTAAALKRSEADVKTSQERAVEDLEGNPARDPKVME